MREDAVSLTLLPSEASPRLPALLEIGTEVLHAANCLGSGLHPTVRRALADLMRSTNCYYSNLIEGHDTPPVDIDRAMGEQYASDPGLRSLQLEAQSHIAVQAMVDNGDLDALGSGQELVRTLHREFTAALPEEMRWITSEADGGRSEAAPGEWRLRDVRVGRHVPVSPELVPSFMNHFDWGYSKPRAATALLQAASSHHRLAWIHPFMDGNGRIGRLHSHAFLRRAGVDTSLWSVSRGLAKTVAAYKAALARADYPPQGAIDGRGTLSERGLEQFVAYFTDTCAGEVREMEDVLEPSGLLERMRALVQERAAADEMDIRAFELMASLFVEGELTVSRASAVLSTGDSTVVEIMDSLVRRRLVVGDGRLEPYRLAFPMADADALFPQLLGGGGARAVTNVQAASHPR